MLLMVLIHSQSFTQVSGKPREPVEFKISTALKKPNSIDLSLRCISHTKFIDGFLSFEVSEFKSKKIDSTILWSGNSDTVRFDQTFHHTIQLSEGKKANVRCLFQVKVSDKTSYSDGYDLYFYHMIDTLLQTEGGYEWLEGLEVDYLIKKRGFEKMTIEEIKAIDPRFAKRIKKVLHVHKGKIYEER